MDDGGDFYCALGWAFARGKDKPYEDYEKAGRIFFCPAAGAAIYRREVFEKIGYFDEVHFAYLEDLDVGYRARILAMRTVMSRRLSFIIWEAAPPVPVTMNLRSAIPPGTISMWSTRICRPSSLS